MQSGVAAHCLLGAAPWSPPQSYLYMGWGGRENEEKISLVEKTIYIEGWAYHLNQEHSGQLAYLQYVPFSNA